MSLENAPPEIQLAVDLIQLLEEHQVDPELVLLALDIVKSDYQKKLANRTKIDQI
ncbi:pleiotropic regulatory protein RsmS [Celerinatantimonas yamalensis]|uniref:Pleiotropic regulatory protein RsmS n=1 Tax=Celerinatantimonas yamalensis TaxID=559956 RepID=A0ABW9G512_9GAMM